VPYAPSAARTKADGRITALRSPFIYAKIRTRSLPTDVRDSIFQNSVFQLSAVLEDYLLDVLSHWFTKLLTGKATNSLMPVVTRAVTLLRIQEELFRRYFGDRDEAGLADRMAASSTYYSLLREADQVPTAEFEKLLVKDKKFPSVRNFRALFRRMGLPNMISMMSKRMKTDFELNLRAFMDIRNALAHENPPSITDVDVARYFRQMARWINAIDRQFYKHVTKISGEAYW
jgi:hypothetical protein